MFTLLRETYPDRPLDPAALQALAEMWVEWYRLWAARGGGDGMPHVEYRLAFEVYGVPRTDMPAVTEALLAGLSGIPGCRAEPGPDADFVRIAGPYRLIPEPPEISLWLALLPAPQVAGLCAFPRVEIHARRRAGSPQPDSRHELVLAGVAGPPGVLLKAAWAERNIPGRRQLSLSAAWPGERHLLDALDTYLHVQAAHLSGAPALPTGAAPGAGPGAAAGPRAADLAAQASYQRFLAGGHPGFSSPATQRGSRHLAGLFVELQEDAGLSRFAARLGATLAPAAVLLGAAALPGVHRDLRVALVVLGCIAAFLPLRVVWLKAKKVRTYKVRMTDGLTRARVGEMRLSDIDLVAAGLDRDVNVRKVTRELLDAGCTWCRDFRMQIDALNAAHRMFVDAESSAEVIVILMASAGRFCCFPVQPTLLLTTRFAGGGQLTTTNATAGTIYRRNRTGLPRTARSLPRADPAAVLQLHRRVARRLGGQRGAPLPPRPQHLFETLLEDRRIVSDATQGKPVYTWGDALHEAFRIVRREYREDEGERDGG